MNEQDTRSLWTKLQAFADGLTSEDQAQLGAIRPDDVAGHLSPSLQAKAQQAAADLTQEEAAQLGQLLQRVRAGAVGGGETDAQGYMKAEYLERDMPKEAAGGSLNWSAANFAIAVLTVAGGLGGAGYGEPSGQ